MDEVIRKILEETKTIAVVGLSDKPERPSYQVAKFLQERGYRIIPVNPRVQEVLGEKAYPSLSSIGEKVDLVDVFRRSEEVLPIAEEALKVKPSCFWMQEGVENEEARSLLEGEGVTVVMNRCIKKEFLRLFGETKS